MDDTKVILGETRVGAIDKVQELLGPVTPRPLAEQTFWALAHDGKITMNEDGVYLIENDVDEKKLRDTATQQLKQQTGQQRRAMRHFSVSHKNFYQARVSTAWNAKAIGILSPTFEGDGVEPDNADD